MNVAKILASAAYGAATLEKSKSYCDYIAHVCAVALAKPDPQRIIKASGPVRYDLHPRDGYLLSSKKTIELEGCNGRKYRLTVEDMSP